MKEQYEILAKDMLRREREGKPITFYHYMLDLTGGPCIYKRISGCGSGTEYMAVTPWGDLYPCHQFVGEEKYKLGDIWHGVTNTALREEFRACNAYARQECRRLLGAAVLLRRLRRQRLSRHRLHPRRLRAGLRAVPQADRVRHHDESRRKRTRRRMKTPIV